MIMVTSRGFIFQRVANQIHFRMYNREDRYEKQGEGYLMST